MTGVFTSVPAGSGDTLDAYLLPSPRGRAPAIVMLTEIFGFNAQMRDAARQWSEAGYTVLVPDLFWRQQRRVELAYEGADRERAFALYRAFDHEQGAADVARCIAALRKNDACDGKVGVIGYCFGGTLAWLAAARSDPDAAVSFYGTQIHRYLSEAGDISCPTALHLGDADAHVPAEAVAATRAAVTGHRMIEFHLYPGIGHAFMNPARPTFDDAATALATQSALALLAHTMANGSRADPKGGQTHCCPTAKA